MDARLKMGFGKPFPHCHIPHHTNGKGLKTLFHCLHASLPNHYRIYAYLSMDNFFIITPKGKIRHSFLHFFKTDMIWNRNCPIKNLKKPHKKESASDFSIGNRLSFYEASSYVRLCFQQQYFFVP